MPLSESLVSAALGGNEEAFLRLIRQGADPSRNGGVALYHALRSGSEAMALAAIGKSDPACAANALAAVLSAGAKPNDAALRACARRAAQANPPKSEAFLVLLGDAGASMAIIEESGGNQALLGRMFEHAAETCVGENRRSVALAALSRISDSGTLAGCLLFLAGRIADGSGCDEGLLEACLAAAPAWAACEAAKACSKSRDPSAKAVARAAAIFGTEAEIAMAAQAAKAKSAPKGI